MPALKRCDKGHFYDNRKHQACPVCTAPAAVDATQAAPKARTPEPASEDYTRAVTPAIQGLTCGWLVCIEGPDKGRDYRVRSGRNFVGRGGKMHICIAGDNTIHRENHAFITFEARMGRFTVGAGVVEDFVYLNGEVVEPAAPRALKPYDVVELGKSKLMFVPLCTEEFQWQN